MRDTTSSTAKPLNATRDFSSWYEAAWSSLVRSVTATTLDAQLAEEAVAEACCRAYERWRRVQQMESPEGWTYRVAINVARRRKRRDATERDLIGSNATARAVDSAPRDDPTVWTLLSSLSDRERQVLALRYIFDMTDREAGRVLGIRASSVSATASRAHKRLRGCLQQDEDSDRRAEE